METGPSQMKPIADLFGSYSIVSAREGKKKRTSERSELVRYFFEHAKPAWKGKTELKPSYVAWKLSHLSVQDLYAFKSMCEDRTRSGYPWAKYFWGSLKEQSWQKAGYEAGS